MKVVLAIVASVGILYGLLVTSFWDSTPSWRRRETLYDAGAALLVILASCALVYGIVELWLWAL